MKIIFKHFIVAIKKYKLDFIKTLVWVVLLSFLNSFIPFAFKKYLEFSTSSNEIVYLFIFLAAFVFYLCVKIGCKILWYRSLDSFGGRYLADTISKCQDSIINSSSYLDLQKNKNVKLKHTLYVDSLNSFVAVGHPLPSLISSCVVLIIIFSISVFINLILTLILIVSVFLGLLISILSKKFITKASSFTNSHLKKMNYEVSCFADCAEIAKINDLGNYFNEKSKNSISDFVKAAKKEDTKTYFWSGISDGYNSLLTYAIAALLALPFFDGTLVNYAFFTLVCAITLEETQLFVGNLRLLFKSEVSFSNVESILGIKSNENICLNSIDKVYATNLNFAIDEKKILDGFSFNFKKGDFVRISGPNGSGKSTLIKLIGGLYGSDDIFFNEGIHAKPLNKMLLIDQNEMLLNEEVIQYLSIVCHKVIRFLDFDKECLHKQIENYGENLSNGEKKKIQIMRFFILENSVDLIILDEVMAGLDIETKRKFSNYLCKKELLDNKIVILIEHDDNLNLPYTQKIQLS